MLKKSAKVFVLGIYLIAVGNANAMFQACYIDTGFKFATFKQIQKKVNMRGMGICYEAAFCLAEAEGNLETQQISFLRSKMNRQPGSTSNYSEEYKEIMNIPSIDGLKTELVEGGALEPHSLGLNSIRESGFINFQAMDGDQNVFHTIYVQVTKGRKKIIYSANSPTLALYLTEYEKSVQSIGGVAVYAVVENNGVATKAMKGFNKYILKESESSGRIGFHFTPVTDVSKNIFNKMPL
jgi:hypothetical protein